MELGTAITGTMLPDAQGIHEYEAMGLRSVMMSSAVIRETAAAPSLAAGVKVLIRSPRSCLRYDMVVDAVRLNPLSRTAGGGRRRRIVIMKVQR